MQLDLISAKRVESSPIWNKYVRCKAEISAKLESQGRLAFDAPLDLDGIRVQTKQCLMEMEFSQAVSAEHLNESLNELILWHGTDPAVAETIAREDFRIPKGKALHGTRFGRGAYLAEDLDKSLSYASMDGNGRQWILLCRALCGDFHHTTSHFESEASDHALRSGKNSVLANPEGQGPREFIVLTESQVYPEYVLEVQVK